MTQESRDFAAVEIENTFDDSISLSIKITGWVISDTEGFTESDAIANAYGEIRALLAENGYTTEFMA